MAMRSVSDSATCAATSGLRGTNRQRRGAGSSPVCTFRSVRMSARECFSAGPSANPAVASRQKTMAPATTAGVAMPSSTMVMGIIRWRLDVIRSTPYRPSATPMAPPASDSTRPSISN